MYVRSVKTVGETSLGPSTLASSWSSGVAFNMTQPVVKLATPTGVNATDTRTDGVNVTWNAVSGAAYYGVWYGGAPGYDSNPDFGGPNNPTLITGTSYLDTAISAGSSRDYYVQAFSSGNPTGTKSDWSAGDSGTRTAAVSAPATPTSVAISGSGLATWSPSSGATSYTVEYYLASNSSGGNASGPYTAGAGSSTSYQVTYQTIGGILLNYARVRVLASNSGGSSLYSAYTGYA
jgi:hypothetical protein